MEVDVPVIIVLKFILEFLHSLYQGKNGTINEIFCFLAVVGRGRKHLTCWKSESYEDELICICDAWCTTNHIVTNIGISIEITLFLDVRKPRIIGPDAMAVEAMKKMEAPPSPVQFLPVITDDYTLIGIVTLHGLVSAGL